MQLTNNSLFLCSTPLGMGTREQRINCQNNEANKERTISLKALASKVLSRNVVENNSGTKSNVVVLPSQNKRTSTDMSYYYDLYEERAAIYEFDAHHSRAKANELAYQEVNQILIEDNKRGVICL